jgi:hypothetical protein
MPEIFSFPAYGILSIRAGGMIERFRPNRSLPTRSDRTRFRAGGYFGQAVTRQT